MPAKASAYSTLSLPDPPLSRAGSLPQWSGADQQSLSQPKSPVGAGLPAKASARSTSSSPDPALSRAGSLPQWSGVRPQSSAQPKSLRERACPRRRRHIQPHHRLSHRFREQAHSHNGPVQGHNLQPNPNPCGSGPAREGAGTVNIIIACHTAFASKLAPTKIRGQISNLFRNPNPCGSEPAREGARSDTFALNDTTFLHAGSPQRQTE